MNTQQRRLFTATATSDVKVGQQQMSSRTLQEHRFRVGPRIAIALAALLFCSCSTLTPDRIAVLAALAGNAAQIGVQAWLTEHPEHRDSFEAVARAIAAFLAAQGTPPDARESTVALVLSNLPNGATFRSKESELYVSGDNLVVWDEKLKKASVVEGKAVEPVLRAVRNGLLRALEPVPPLPSAPPAAVRVRTHRANVPTNNAYPLNWQLPAPANPLVISNLMLIGHTPLVESPTPVPAGKYAPRGVGIYRVEKKSGTNWLEIQSFSSGPAEFRVRRVR